MNETTKELIRSAISGKRFHVEQCERRIAEAEGVLRRETAMKIQLEAEITDLESELE